MSTKALYQCQWEYREKGCVHEYVDWRVTFVESYTKESGTELCIRMCSYMFFKTGVLFTMVKHPHLTLNVSSMLDTTTSPTYFPAAHRLSFSVVPWLCRLEEFDVIPCHPFSNQSCCLLPRTFPIMFTRRWWMVTRVFENTHDAQLFRLVLRSMSVPSLSKEYAGMSSMTLKVLD